MDTSVLFQAFYSRRGASHRIFRMIRHGEIAIAISVPVFHEYRDVLSRETSRAQLDLSVDEVTTVMQFIATIGRATNISYKWRPNLRDETDNMLIELARASGSEYLITRNIRDFTLDADLNNDDLRVVTPSEFIQEWREHHEI